MNNIDIQTKKCLQYIKDNYSDFISLSIEDIVKIALQYGESDARNNAAKWYKEKLEEEKKQQEIEEARQDYEEYVDDNGRTWYKMCHFYHQKDRSRKLKECDIIRYRGGNVYGLMIIGGFAFKSDFAAREYYGNCTHITHKGTENEQKTTIVSSGSYPSFNEFSFATDNEIKSLFEYLKENDPKMFNYFLFESNYKPKGLDDLVKKYGVIPIKEKEEN